MRNLRPGTHSFDADGTRLVYHVAGAGPVLITHSGGPGVEYSYLRSPALEKLFTVVYLEPAGTGASGPLPEGATYVETYVDLLYALVEHLAVPQVHLLGHSHGGFVAQRFAMLHPDRVAGLALYSTSATTTSEFWAAQRAAVAAYPQRHPDVPDATSAVEGLGQGRPETDDEKTANLRLALPVYFADYWGRRAEFKQLREGVRAWLTPFASTTIDYRAELPSITARTVVITGRHDFICGPVWAEGLHQGIPGSRLVVLEESGHFGQIEEPEAFVEAVTWLL
ncbi:alpha/beta fold hydrolase [Micromonospora sp. NPDC050397]|uniref:alpha/beta fold hydrolase n=1 Tax=Micromonospora sp. NPDC050397 TaxID=3364279 RepID=UPI00384CB7D0